MKNKDKYELSGADEDLSGRIDFNININSNKSQETTETDTYSKIKKKYEQEKVRQKVKEMAEGGNFVSSVNVVIPENIKDNNSKNEEFKAKYKNDYSKKKEYKIYEEPIVTTKYNNGENKTEPTKANRIQAICMVVFWIVIIMIYVICNISDLIAVSMNKISYNNIDTTWTSKNKIPIDKVIEDDIYDYELNKEICQYKGIKTRIIENEFGEKAVFITNLNDKDFKAFQLSIVFYDENRNIVGISNEYFRILPTSHTIVADLNSDIPEYDTYEIFYDEKKVYNELEYDQTTYLFDGVSFENIKENSNLIKFDVKNNLSQSIDELAYVALLYKDNEIVYFRHGFIYELKERKSEEEIIYVNEELEYDNIEFIVNYMSVKN